MSEDEKLDRDGLRRSCASGKDDDTSDGFIDPHVIKRMVQKDMSEDEEIAEATITMPAEEEQEHHPSKAQISDSRIRVKRESRSRCQTKGNRKSMHDLETGTYASRVDAMSEDKASRRHRSDRDSKRRGRASDDSSDTLSESKYRHASSDGPSSRRDRDAKRKSRRHTHKTTPGAVHSSDDSTIGSKQSRNRHSSQGNSSDRASRDMDAKGKARRSRPATLPGAQAAGPSDDMTRRKDRKQHATMEAAGIDEEMDEINIHATGMEDDFRVIAEKVDQTQEDLRIKREVVKAQRQLQRKQEHQDGVPPDFSNVVVAVQQVNRGCSNKKIAMVVGVLLLVVAGVVGAIVGTSGSSTDPSPAPKETENPTTSPTCTFDPHTKSGPCLPLVSTSWRS